MRGTELQIVRPVCGLGITPACAGNRLWQHRAIAAHGDHPRVCGEQFDQRLQPLHAIGSPPRVRGTDEFADQDTQKERITPACAGNSTGHYSAPPISKDHPRVCGEQLRPASILWLHWGSPPRVRGTGFPAASLCSISRITPACAGNSPGAAFARLIFKDHPRVCGEQ